jgi:hypothetical protein
MRIVSQPRTKKRHKVLQLIGVLALLLGVVIRVGTGELGGTVIAVLGLLLFVLGRLAAWWRAG